MFETPGLVAKDPGGRLGEHLVAEFRNLDSATICSKDLKTGRFERGNRILNWNIDCERYVEDRTGSRTNDLWVIDIDAVGAKNHGIGTGRIDFLAGAVGIECKVDGAPAAVARQVLRYCGSGMCDDGVLLVTTKASHRAIRGINSFPIRVLVLAGGLS